jgi:inhibitor of KinA sporulation pathway (predicted exonuclease)
MAKLLDEIIVVDVESTAWENEPPPGEVSEIIEIGICPLDIRTGEPLQKEAILVRPERSKVSGFCTRLTTLTQEQVDQGVTIREACATLKSRYRTKERLWASYGDYDRRQFERVCAASKTGYPFGPGHINVKSLFAVVRNLPREIGMKGALDQIGLPLVGTHHRGVDDAWNIACILGRILKTARSPDS